MIVTRNQKLLVFLVLLIQLCYWSLAYCCYFKEPDRIQTQTGPLQASIARLSHTLNLYLYQHLLETQMSTLAAVRLVGALTRKRQQLFPFIFI